jgi:DNA replication licensing factor MCM2
VIAAANPVKGNYDDKLSFKENVDLSDPILSRFDVLLVLKDELNVIND